MTPLRRYAVLGTGYFGAELARILATLPQARVTHVYDPEHAEPLGRELGATVCASPDAAIEADVDAVIVASPNWAHHDAVVAAARAGRHVFCEKPIALSHPDCVAMVAACAEAGVHFMAAHVMHFFPGVRAAKRAIAAGEIGDVLFVHTARTGWDARPSAGTWKKQVALSGGHLYHHIHELDFLQSILGVPERVHLAGGNVAHQGSAFGDEPDLLIGTLDFGHAHGLVQYGSAQRWPEHHVLIQGTLGAIRLDLTETKLEIVTPSGRRRELVHGSAELDAERSAAYVGRDTDGGVQFGRPDERPPRWLRAAMRDELAHFDGWVAGGEVEAEFAPLADGSAAMASIATADALTLSLQERRVVALAEITGRGPDAPR